MKLLLASKSPRRRELIKQITENVEFLDNDVDETLENIDELSPIEVAKSLAHIKAIGSRSKENMGFPIIGSDTIVVLDNTIFGKPKNREEAYEMLKMLSGNTHSVITGVSILLPDNTEDIFFDETKVSFNNLSDKQINDYIDTGDPFDKAGSYGIQNLPENFLLGIDGDYNNVVGLPVENLKNHLESLNLL